jgi:hypothetical protein
MSRQVFGQRNKFSFRAQAGGKERSKLEVSSLFDQLLYTSTQSAINVCDSPQF